MILCQGIRRIDPSLHLDLMYLEQISDDRTHGLVMYVSRYVDSQGLGVGKQYSWTALHNSFDNRTEILAAGWKNPFIFTYSLLRKGTGTQDYRKAQLAY